jgi:hypothetical protein
LTAHVLTTIHAAIRIAQELVRFFYLVGIFKKRRRPQRSKALERKLGNALVQLRFPGRFNWNRRGALAAFSCWG